jgi:large subunit ribosomal protein L32e
MTEQDTTALEKALKLRTRIKKKKPRFANQESWRYKRLKENWRRPRGIDNKMRRKIKGWPPTVSVGYRGPRATRGLHPSGYREILVHNLQELKKINPKIQAIRIAHTIGKRKRAKILAEARKGKIKILNFREPKKTIREEREIEETEEREKDEEVAEKGSPRSKQKNAKELRRRTEKP